MFPKTRHRRLRQNSPVRELLRETKLEAAQLILPFFVTHGRGVKKPISSMPGQFQLSLDELLKQLAKVEKAGIRAVILFGIPKLKDPVGSEAYAPDGIIQLAIRAIRKSFPDLIVLADLCFCEYTDHGHCGIIKKEGRSNFEVDNDATLEIIRKTAAAQAEAGAHFIAPSGMTDGAVKAIREELDNRSYLKTGILAYSAKYASAFYGPFREAAESAPQFGDRKTYQMDPANIREALKEIRSDIDEGADMVMVKPALSYLDVISKAKEEFHVPVVAYNVSGEYSMVKAAEQLGWMDGERAALEILQSIKRAGADLIITYHALEIAPHLK
ncbi:MAG: porphobilinogen synthase [Elusimicrobia bacterium]|nr:porphobilinogen synthase [Candidatus Obscuribacterium magneticum]